MKNIPLFLTLILLPQLSFGQSDSRVKSIDKYIEVCQSTREGSSTLGMKQCYMDGSTKMDSLLNIVYKELLKDLKSDDQEKLRTSQRNWLKFYESEQVFTREVYRSWANYSKYEYGSQINVTESRFTYTLIKERVQRLINYRNAE